MARAVASGYKPSGSSGCFRTDPIVQAKNLFLSVYFIAIVSQHNLMNLVTSRTPKEYAPLYDRRPLTIVLGWHSERWFERRLQ